MEEYIDILTKDGKSTGKTALKSEIHKKGHFHHTAHVWFYTTEGEILLAQRSGKKALHPLLWDVSVAGHVDAGETVIQGAIREVYEEIGLKIMPNDLKKIGVFECFQSYENGIVDNEFHHTFIALLRAKLKDLEPQQGEVEQLKLVNFKEFDSILKNIGHQNHLVASNKIYYEKVFETISGEIT
jgi:isopentenyldiphosphate isomerase